MAFVDNTTFTGKDAEGFYSTALLTGDTKSVIKLIPNVKSKIKLASIDLSNIVQAAGCSFNNSGTTTLAQKTLEVCDYRVNLEFCTADWEVNYLSTTLRAGSNAAQIPTSASAFIAGEIAKGISADTENLLWQGDTSASPADACDGFLTLFEADSSVLTVTAVSGGLTSSNIITEIGKVYEKIPCTISERGKVVIFIPCSAAKFYREALAAANSLFTAFNTGNLEMNYLGVKLITAQGLPDDVMVAAEPENLWFGTDLMGDFEDLQIINMFDTTGSNSIRFVSQFKFGVQYGVGEEIVVYS